MDILHEVMRNKLIPLDEYEIPENKKSIKVKTYKRVRPPAIKKDERKITRKVRTVRKGIKIRRSKSLLLKKVLRKSVVGGKRRLGVLGLPLPYFRKGESGGRVVSPIHDKKARRGGVQKTRDTGSRNHKVFNKRFRVNGEIRIMITIL